MAILDKYRSNLKMKDFEQFPCLVNICNCGFLALCCSRICTYAVCRLGVRIARNSSGHLDLSKKILVPPDDMNVGS
ncbi:hypothetical protein Pelo_16680 [Pelomyxa schiedti]|nr:hypothetical protein Pelo_16680 [Pelomyxa schiedti]